MNLTRPQSRTGTAKNLTLDKDVLPLIPHLTQNRKSVGKLVSELIRAEVTRREERARRVAEGQAPWAPYE